MFSEYSKPHIFSHKQCIVLITMPTLCCLVGLLLSWSVLLDKTLFSRKMWQVNERWHGPQRRTFKSFCWITFFTPVSFHAVLIFVGEKCERLNTNGYRYLIIANVNWAWRVDSNHRETTLNVRRRFERSELPPVNRDRIVTEELLRKSSNYRVRCKKCFL